MASEKQKQRADASPAGSTSAPLSETAKDRHGWAASALGFALALMAPVPVFLRHRHLSPLTTDGLVVAITLFGLGLALLAWPWMRRRWPLAAVYGFALLLFIDFQYQLQGKIPAYLVWLVASVAVCWVFGAILPKMFITAFGIMTVLSLWQPARDGAAAELRSELPPILHIVLDEHVGLAALPKGDEGPFLESSAIPNEAGFADQAEDEASGLRMARMIRASYVERGFRVYEQGFSYFDSTRHAIAALLNGDVQGKPELFERVLSRRYRSLKHSTLFDQLIDVGYQIDVFQSDWIDVCGAAPVASCHTETVWGLGPLLQDDPWWSPTRYVKILSALTRRSRLLMAVRVRVNDAARALSLPAWMRWNNETRWTGPLGFTPLIERIGTEPELAGPGKAVFLHVLHPHHPYVYDASCNVKPLDGWNRPSADSRSGDPYFEQVECATKQVGQMLDRLLARPEFANSTILIHGDHGARRQPFSLDILEKATDSELETLAVDRFSTLIAVRSPGLEPGLDQQPVSLQGIAAHLWDLPTKQTAPADVLRHLKLSSDEPKTLPLPMGWRSDSSFELKR